MTMVSRPYLRGDEVDELDFDHSRPRVRKAPICPECDEPMVLRGVQHHPTSRIYRCVECGITERDLESRREFE